MLLGIISINLLWMNLALFHDHHDGMWLVICRVSAQILGVEQPVTHSAIVDPWRLMVLLGIS